MARCAALAADAFSVADGGATIFIMKCDELHAAILNAELEPDPVIEVYKRDVDRTLLRENLKKTPEERVLALMRLQRVAEEAAAAGKRLRGD
jgi:hypothetical protein